jgi:hypothetical protein
VNPGIEIAEAVPEDDPGFARSQLYARRRRMRVLWTLHALRRWTSSERPAGRARRRLVPIPACIIWHCVPEANLLAGPRTASPRRRRGRANCTLSTYSRTSGRNGSRLICAPVEGLRQIGNVRAHLRWPREMTERSLLRQPRIGARRPVQELRGDHPAAARTADICVFRHPWRRPAPEGHSKRPAFPPFNAAEKD